MLHKSKVLLNASEKSRVYRHTEGRHLVLRGPASSKVQEMRLRSQSCLRLPQPSGLTCGIRRGGGALEHMEPQGSFWMNAKPAIQPGLARCDKAMQDDMLTENTCMKPFKAIPLPPQGGAHGAIRVAPSGPQALGWLWTTRQAGWLWAPWIGCSDRGPLMLGLL